MLDEIPKVIHAVWFGGPIPDEELANVRSWQQHLQGWPIILWTDKAGRRGPWTEERIVDWDKTMFAGVVPSFQDLFQGCARYGAMSDVLRLDILLKEGGLYMDLDIEVKSGISIALNPMYLTAFEEGNGTDMWIGNAMLAASPWHPAVSACLRAVHKQLIDSCIGASILAPSPHFPRPDPPPGGYVPHNPVYETGPRIITKALAGRDDVMLIPAAACCPGLIGKSGSVMFDHKFKSRWLEGSGHERTPTVNDLRHRIGTVPTKAV